MVYGKAHLRALTPPNIKVAFRKTGVWPFNPNILPEEAFAPSRTTSCKSHLPVPPATPVCTITKLLHKLSIEESIEEAKEPTVAINHTTSQESLPNSFSETLTRLATGTRETKCGLA